MKKIVVFFVLYCCSCQSAIAQKSEADSLQKDSLARKQITITGKDGTVHTVTKFKSDAKFPGGDKAWMVFLQSKLDSFKLAGKGVPAGRYKVKVKFTISKTGKLTNAEAVTSNGYGMEKAVLDILKESPDWQPALEDGLPVDTIRFQPINFFCRLKKADTCIRPI